MISVADYQARGWDVIPAFARPALLPEELLIALESHPQSPGKSSWGTRNVLQAFILSMRPKLVVEIGGHIGSASLVIGAALRANRFGRLVNHPFG